MTEYLEGRLQVHSQTEPGAAGEVVELETSHALGLLSLIGPSDELGTHKSFEIMMCCVAEAACLERPLVMVRGSDLSAVLEACAGNDGRIRYGLEQSGDFAYTHPIVKAYYKCEWEFQHQAPLSAEALYRQDDHVIVYNAPRA